MAYLARNLLKPILFCSLLGVVTSLPSHAAHARILNRGDLLEEYDFIVAGAGTAGLTVGDRLSENGKYTVLVVEYGYLDTSPSITYVMAPNVPGPPNPDAIRDSYSSASRSYNVTSVPQSGLNNRTQSVLQGAVVGGSSAINGMFFDRGSAEDYDSWIPDSHQAEYAEEWGWTKLLPWFKKSVTFHPPTQLMAEAYGMTADIEGAYGGTAAVHSSYPPFQWPIVLKIFDAFKSVPGVKFPIEHANGNATGVFFVPNSVEPTARTRSYSGSGHYFNDKGASTRPNFHILPAYRVTQVIFDPPATQDGLWQAREVIITPRDGPMPAEGPHRIRAGKEIVVSAGAIHTPQILQRSGIGPKDVLQAAKVDVKVELPGVGANLQDHMYFTVAYNFTKRVFPRTTDLSTNETFLQESLALWNKNKTGPFSGYPSGGAWLPLSVISNKTDDLVGELLAQDPAEYLPVGTHQTVVAGYASQRKSHARQLRSRKSALLELPLGGGSSFSALLLKQHSRGRVWLAPNDDGVNQTGRGNVEPIVDYRSFSNPLDIKLTIEMLKFIRYFTSGAAMQETFGPVETSPGPKVVSDQEIEAWIRQTIVATDGHLVGTAALGPRELGGVVGPDLTVHGTVGLSVADNSIIPLVPGTHTSSTAYAIGEKAADLVLRRHG